MLCKLKHLIATKDKLFGRKKCKKGYSLSRLRGNPVWICLFLFFASCNNDITIADSRETAVIVDSYIQPDPVGELDVLVVLDTSGSMSDNYDDVASGMDLLRQDIESLTLDYKFGYITMDPTQLSYVGPYDSSSTAIDMLMAPNLLPGTSLEEGFAATYAFLNSEVGEGFRRDEADFLLFLISDEDEQSAISSDLFYDWMQDKFKDVNHDIVCVANPADENAGWASEPGYKYIELSDLYGKSLIDIKQEDWSEWLSASSYLIHEKDFVLLSEPDPIVETIVVYVDYAVVHNWIYIEEGNVVQLNFVPGNGSLVEVGYEIYVN